VARDARAEASSAADWIPLIVDRLVRQFQPLKIILFGSHATGDARAASDLDLLVVLPRVEDRLETEVAMRRALSDLRVAKDIIATDPDELARRGDSLGTVYRAALREGRVIYGVDDRDAGIWLRYAKEDLEAAERMVAGRGFAPRWACFLAQQAADKALKAALVSEGLPFPFTHDLDYIRELVPGERKVAALDVDLRRLTTWAVVGRYPTADPEATREDARDAVEAARAALEAVEADLAEPGPGR